VIFREDPYGWGVSRIPMARDIAPESSAGPAGHPLVDTGRDLPWYPMGLSFLLALLTFWGIILWDRILQEPPVQPPSPPVVVAVRLLEEVPEPPAEPLPEPPPVPVKVVREEPKAPAPRPEKPVKAVEPAPKRLAKAEVEPPPAVVPPPRPVARQRIARREPEPAPVFQVTRETAPAATVPVVAPTAVDYRRETAESKLPERSTTVARRRSAAVPGPAARTTAAPRPTEESLPDTATVSIGSSSLVDLPSPAGSLPGTSPTRSRPARTASLAPSSAGLRGGSAELDLPGPTAASPSGERGTGPQRLPSGPRMTGISGDAAATVSLPGPLAERTAGPKAAGSEGISESYERLDLLGPGELDPSVAMSLSRLRTCRDPGEETTLKSRLAAMLPNPTRCRSGGVVFDIRNVESAYSAHIDIYNYEQREFEDRCAALRVTIDACAARR